jgi:hypothetical protein
MNEFHINPKLTEPGVKSFLNRALKDSHIYKEKYYNIVFNLGLFLFFIILVGLILYFKYKGKISPLEKVKKEKEKMGYIMEKIANFQIAKKQIHQELISGLPVWESEVENINKKYLY